MDPENRMELVRAIRELQVATPDDLSFWFHEHPRHSVGHLHMHVLLNTTITDAFAIHEHKNLSFDDAVRFIN